MGEWADKGDERLVDKSEMCPVDKVMRAAGGEGGRKARSFLSWWLARAPVLSISSHPATRVLSRRTASLPPAGRLHLTYRESIIAPLTLPQIAPRTIYGIDTNSN